MLSSTETWHLTHLQQVRNHQGDVPVHQLHKVLAPRSSLESKFVGWGSTYKQEQPLTTVEVLTDAGTLLLLGLPPTMPWEQIQPLTNVPFSLFEGIIPSFSLVCNKNTQSHQLKVLQCTLPQEQQKEKAEREGQRQDRLLYHSSPALLPEQGEHCESPL